MRSDDCIFFCLHFKYLKLSGVKFRREKLSILNQMIHMESKSLLLKIRQSF